MSHVTHHKNTLTLPPLGEGGAKRRMRALRRTLRPKTRHGDFFKALIRPSGTFSQREKGVSRSFAIALPSKGREKR
jgi:hypothetical protein